MVKTAASLVVSALLAALYVYAIVAGVGNLQGMIGLSGAIGVGLSGAGWFWLGFGIVWPTVVFAAALAIGRRRGWGVRILLLAAGLSLVAVTQLNVLHLVPQVVYFAT